MMKSREALTTLKSPVAKALIVGVGILGVAGCGENEKSKSATASPPNPDEIVSVMPHFKKSSNKPKFLSHLPKIPDDVSCKRIDFPLDPTSVSQVVTAPDTGTYEADFVGTSLETGTIQVIQRPEGSDIPISVTVLPTDNLKPHRGPYMQIADTYYGAYLDVMITKQAPEQVNVAARMCAPNATQNTDPSENTPPPATPDAPNLNIS